MKKHLRYLTNITRLSFLRIYYYPRDFIWFILMMPIFLCSEFGGYYFMFYANNFEHIAGFSLVEIIFVTSTLSLVWLLSSLSNLSSGVLSYQINSGELDPLLLLPLSPSITIWGHFIHVKKFLLIFLRLVILSSCFIFGSISFTSIEILQFIFIVISSIVLFHALFIVFESLAFWFPNLEMSSYLYELSNEFIMYPKSMYPPLMQQIFTILLPIFLLGNPLYAVFSKTYTWYDSILVIFLCIFWIFLATIVWEKGLRRYESAS